MSNEYKIVMYTDGGCRPSGQLGDVGGWGVHGYIADLVLPKKGLGLGAIIASDRGYLKKDSEVAHKPVTVIGYLDGVGSVTQEPTNNKAELKAFIQALNFCLVTCKHGTIINEEKIVPKSVLILADSKYVTDGFNQYLDTWKRNQWRTSSGNQIKNIDYWTMVLDLKDELTLANISVEVIHVYGHTGDLGNEISDSWATNGIVLGRKRDLNDLPITVSPIENYWGVSNRNRFFCTQKLYFNCHVVGNDISKDGRHVYYIGDHGKDDTMAGKPISSNTFGVLYLKDPVSEIEDIKKLQDAVTPYGRGTLIFGRLDNIYNANMNIHLRKYSTKFLHKDSNTRNYDLHYGIFPKHIPITEEMYPPRMGFSIMDKLNDLEDKLETYLRNRDLICVTDITDVLYEKLDTKKKITTSLRKEFGVSTKTLTVNVKYVLNGKFNSIDLVQTFGIDLLPRNDLAALASEDIKVFIITWPESSITFRYACIVENTNDIALFCAGYSNRMVISHV